MTGNNELNFRYKAALLKPQNLITLLVVFVFLISISGVFLVSYRDSSVRNKKADVTALLQDQSLNIKNDVTVTMERVHSLRALIIGTKGNVNDAALLGEYIVKDPYVSNYLIAPNGIVQEIFPDKSNRDIIGLDLFSPENASYLDALKAKDSRDIVMSGPFKLKQGGEAFSGRLAVYLHDDAGKEKFWGLVSVSVKFPDIINKRNSSVFHSDKYDFVLYKENPATKEYETILESKTGQYSDYVYTDFSLFGSNMRLSAVPTDGWLDARGLLVRAVYAFSITLLMLLIVAFIIINVEHWIDRANHDSLTGALNRAGCINKINNIIRADLHSSGLFILIDVDYFKLVNDKMGHQKGDELLIRIYKNLTGVCRTGDIICRLGGDEFVLFFPFRGNRDFAYTKAEQIRKTLMFTLSDADNSIDITVSIGATFVENRNKNFLGLYKEADESLYISKANGRNCVTFYEETVPQSV